MGIDPRNRKDDLHNEEIDTPSTCYRYGGFGVRGVQRHPSGDRRKH